MRAKFHAQFPDSIDMTMTVSMSLEDWKKLRGQLGASAYSVWPLCDLVSSIDAVVIHAEKHFESNQPSREGVK